MRYAIKHGGMIYVGHSRDAVVDAVQEDFGAHLFRGEPVSWYLEVERVDEQVLDLLREDYTVVDILSIGR